MAIGSVTCHFQDPCQSTGVTNLQSNWHPLDDGFVLVSNEKMKFGTVTPYMGKDMPGAVWLHVVSKEYLDKGIPKQILLLSINPGVIQNRELKK